MPSSVTGVQTCALDRKSTRLNSSHTITSYAVFCLKTQSASNRPTPTPPPAPPTHPTHPTTASHANPPALSKGHARPPGEHDYGGLVFFFFPPAPPRHPRPLSLGAPSGP